MYAIASKGAFGDLPASISDCWVLIDLSNVSSIAVEVYLQYLAKAISVRNVLT